MTAVSPDRLLCASELPLSDTCIKYKQDLYDTPGKTQTSIIVTFLLKQSPIQKGGGVHFFIFSIKDYIFIETLSSTIFVSPPPPPPPLKIPGHDAVYCIVLKCINSYT